MPGQKGTKKFLDHYGAKLICVRYRYDVQQRKRVTTVEIIVEEFCWTPAAVPVAEPIIVGLCVGLNEVAVQPQIKQAGGKWNRQQQVWDIVYDQAVALGLKDRIQNPEVSSIRHQPLADKRTPAVSNTRR